MNRVYLDNAATTAVKPEVIKALHSFTEGNFGNPSSIHSFGQQARKSLDEARLKVAKFLGCQSSEVIFASGATEAINLALSGLVKSFKDEKVHIITSAVEHHAVLHTLKHLEREGIEVSYLKPNPEGIVNPEAVKKAIKKNTRLVSIMYVNNEIGSVNPIREIGKLIESQNQDRKKRIYFHTDAVQGISYFNHNVDYLHVDLLDFSGHKIGAPKGVGVLYIRKGTPIKPIIFGGSQEFGLRAGTENMIGIVGLAEAVKTIQNSKLNSPAGGQNSKLEKIRQYFISKIQNEIQDVEVNGSKDSHSPAIINLYFKYIEGESIVLSLDLEGIAASTGSACTSTALEPSHVIMACYNDAARAAGSVRFSLSQNTSIQELDYTVSKLKTIVKRLRDISPYGRR